MSGKKTTKRETNGKARQNCFIAMPISDPPGYPTGHFKKVYEDLIVPAIDMAGYQPIISNLVRGTHVIQLDIIERLLEAPMMICDLSALNPNVMFELGIRQAFDKPVVLLKDELTLYPFDTQMLRTVPYLSARAYQETVHAQAELSEAISATANPENTSQINSLVGLLNIQRAVNKSSSVSAGDRIAFVESRIAAITENAASSAQLINTLDEILERIRRLERGPTLPQRNLVAHGVSSIVGAAAARSFYRLQTAPDGTRTAVRNESVSAKQSDQKKGPAD